MRLRAVWLHHLSLLWNETMLLGDVDTVGQKRFFRKYARSNEFVSRNLKPFGPLWNASEGAACGGVGFRTPFTYNSVRQFLIQCTRRITINKIGRSKFTFVAWSNKNDLWKTVSLMFEFWQILWQFVTQFVTKRKFQSSDCKNNFWVWACGDTTTLSVKKFLPYSLGVPQGSIFGPLYFLLFVDDMPLHLNNSTIDIYSDYTTLSLNANWNNITSLTRALSNDLENIEKWSTENKMNIKSITCYG